MYQKQATLKGAIHKTGRQYTSRGRRIKQVPPQPYRCYVRFMGKRALIWEDGEDAESEGFFRFARFGEYVTIFETASEAKKHIHLDVTFRAERGKPTQYRDYDVRPLGNRDAVRVMEQ